MDDWRRNRSESYNPQYYQPVSKSFGRSQYRKPPQKPPADFFQPPVQSNLPAWERKFLINVCKMPWGRFMHCQKGLDLYTDIFQWDDLAGREAFHNAKGRYWAEIHRQPCNVSLPDPGMYIDVVDWNAWTDPKLYKDLEELLEIPDEVTKDVKSGFDCKLAYSVDAPIIPTGWGDDEANVQGSDNKGNNNNNPWTQTDSWGGIPWGSNNLSSLMKPIIQPECVDGNVDPSMTANNTSWEPVSQDDNRKTGNEANNPWEGNSLGKTSNNVNPWEGNSGGWNHVHLGSSSPQEYTTNEPESLSCYQNSGSWRSGNDNWRKRENEGQQMSRYKTTRYQGNDYQTDQGWRNNRGRKQVSFAHDHSQAEPLVSRQWNSINICGPVNHHRPGEAGSSWKGWEKQVSHRIN